MSKYMDSNNTDDVSKRALGIIISNLKIDLDKISNETEFAKVEIDSITFIKIVVAIEREFGFEFDDEKLLITEFPTIKSMISYIDRKVRGEK